ncbi:MAG: polysaccharide biosynthesis protein [Deltaproteobacteria bacterium]|nr:polysaccharide biosynthesis protein [Deltaproteobacteria bacterium]
MEQDRRTFIKDILKDAWKYTPSHLVPGLCGFLSIFVFTRLLSPEEYAKYILVLTSVAFAANIGFGWLNFSALRFFDESKSESGPFFSTCAASFFLSLSLISFIGYVLIFVLKRLGISGAYDLPFALGVFLLASKTVFDLFLIILRAERLPLRFSLLRTADSIIKLVLGVLFVSIFKWAHEGLLWGMIISFSVLSLYEVLHSRIYLSIRFRMFSKVIMKSMFRYGFPLMGAAITGTALSLADRYMLSFFRSYDEVGIYSAGYRFAEMLIETPGSILLLAYTPLLLQKFNTEPREEFGQVIVQPLRLVLITILPLAAASAFLSKDLGRLFLGARFTGVHEIFPWICSGIFFSCLNQVFTRVFELKKATRLVLMISGLAAGTNIVLNLVLIPEFGYMGAAFATTAAYLIQLAASVKMSRVYIPVPLPLSTLFVSIAATSAMCAVIVLLSGYLEEPAWIALPSKVLAGAFSYAAILLLLREPTITAFLHSSRGRLHSDP